MGDTSVIAVRGGAGRHAADGEAAAAVAAVGPVIAGGRRGIQWRGERPGPASRRVAGARWSVLSQRGMDLPREICPQAD
ncbi:Myopalladin [Manis pentadactyla]|nr:Myopalladin [Manis pentadactyla]